MWRSFFRYLTLHKVGAVLIETGLVVVCVLADTLNRPVAFSSTEYAQWFLRALFVALVFQVSLHLRDVYDFRDKPSTPEFLVRLGQALLLASAALTRMR